MTTEVKPLHIEFRPRNFDEVIGNQSLISQLKSITKRKEGMPHSFMFTGPSGCGKTTLGRILAEELGCNIEFDFTEINAANNRGIDTAREIMSITGFAPKAGKSSIILIDECFAKGTKIKTPNGDINIEEIKKGNAIYNIRGKTFVKNVFINRVDLERIVKINLSNNSNIFCSKDHLFLTNSEWKKAKDLVKEDFILQFDYKIILDNREEKRFKNNEKYLSILQKGIYPKNQKYRSKILLSILQKQSQNKNSYSFLQTMREKIRDQKKRKIYKKVLQSKLFFKIWLEPSLYDRNTEVKRENPENSKISRLVQKRKSSVVGKFASSIFGKNEKEKSFPQSESNLKSKGDKKNKWDFAQMVWRTWRQWEIYPASNSFGFCFGLANGDSNIFRQNDEGISNMLQSRYWEQKFEDSNRNRRPLSQIERATANRYKKRKQAERIRVDNIEIYERGCNEQSFKDIIGDKEKNQGYVNFYDLEIDGHPSYFANNIAVHNCQATTKDFQQALLKPLEDTPSHIYFILCTTDPNKIIQTIKNRCTIFEVKRLDKKEIAELVDWVSKESGYGKLEKEVLEELFYVSEGCPRQALVVLDKILDLKLVEQLKALKDISITEESKEVIALINAFLKSKKHDWKTISDVLKDIQEDPEKIRWAILGYMNKVLLGGKTPDADNAAIIINNFSEPFYNSGKAGLTLACWDSFKDLIPF
ncbi:MAG: AAA family ATPase [Novosphingobium sp.]|jgi:DNA polymerase III gamma/tau subunit|nr:AAA family ATPase [Novosphingobium sp.]